MTLNRDHLLITEMIVNWIPVWILITMHHIFTLEFAICVWLKVPSHNSCYPKPNATCKRQARFRWIALFLQQMVPKFGPSSATKMTKEGYLMS